MTKFFGSVSTEIHAIEEILRWFLKLAVNNKVYPFQSVENIDLFNPPLLCKFWRFSKKWYKIQFSNRYCGRGDRQT